MSLDGGWDADDPWIGSVVNSHTNLTKIQSAMDLLWRNDIDPIKVVMGLGFYGRSKSQRLFRIRDMLELSNPAYD